MAYLPSPNCMAAATAAAGAGKVTSQEVLAAFERMDNYRKTLDARGQLTGRAERMRKFAEEEAERAMIAAAQRKKHAAINVLVRQRLDAHLDGLIDAGVRYDKAMLAMLEGTAKGVRDGRKSVAANVQAHEARYTGAMMADLQRDRPHLIALLRDEKFDADVMREMMEIREDGKPGITGNDDAKYVANLFATYAELSRTDLNSYGASIGKLNGWAGPQTHDDIRMVQAGKDAWVGTVTAHLDVERTFPEGLTGEEMARALGDIYDTIITGISPTATPGEMGQRVNPANLANSLGKSRVLHFKNAEAALAYRAEFGYGNTISGMFSHLRRAAKVAGAMQMLGPNPEVMFTAMAESLKRKMRDGDLLSPREKRKVAGRLDVQAGALRHALDIATGLNSRPVNVTAARIGSDIRAGQSMAKLGGAVISSVSDTVTSASASQFRGSGFVRGMTAQWAGIMRGRPKGEQAEIAYLIGEGFDGIVGHVTNLSMAVDGPVGVMGALQDKFFRWNGLTWWTDVNRSVAGRVLASEMGMRLEKSWDALPPRFRHVLELHGLTDAHWSVMQKATLRMSNGRPYLTPDRLLELTDQDLAPLAGDRLLAAQAGNPRTVEARTAQVFADTRREMQLALLRFYADETASAVIETNARSQRTATWGSRPGTALGEVMRFVMQFKGYPIAFTQRVLGRQLYGHRKGTTALEKMGHIGSLLAGLTIAGYMAMTAKDILKGYWPPRDPTDWRTILAAAQQGGAWGIYGDYLFSQTNRFGGGLLETTVGPTIGTAFDLINTGMAARDYAMGKLAGDDDAKFSGSQAFTTLWGNVPFANLFYVKPALDYLFVNSIREALSPGYLRRQERNRERNYGQRSIAPVGPTLAGDMAQ